MLEQRLLRAHLRNCAACATFAADVQSITIRLRTAPVNRPANGVVVARLRKRSLLQRIPGSHAVSQLAAVAAGATVAVTMGSWFSGETVRTVSTPPIVIDEVSLAEVAAEPAELRAFRRAAVLSETPAAPWVGKHPGTQPLDP